MSIDRSQESVYTTHTMAGSRRDLEQWFCTRLARPVSVVLTDNVRSMVSFRRDGHDGLVLRMHKMFHHAPADVLEAVAGWMQRPGPRPRAVTAFLRENADRLRAPRPPRPRRLRPRGRHHRLDVLFAGLNAEYFDSRLEMRITWGSRPRKARPRTLCLGTYTHETGLITVSPRLDRAWVPRYFVAYVVYHEMLHASLGVEEDARGRRRVHTPRFRRLERRFRDFDRAAAFERRFFGPGPPDAARDSA